MKQLSVRLAQFDDVGGVAELFDAYRQFYGMPADVAGAAMYLRERLERSESVLLIAEDAAHQMIGFCQLYPTFCSVFAARIYVLYDLFVKPESRKSGAGKALLAAAERYAADHGAVRMDLRTAKTNLPAQSLYQSTGWKRDERFQLYSKVPE